MGRISQRKAEIAAHIVVKAKHSFLDELHQGKYRKLFGDGGDTEARIACDRFRCDWVLAEKTTIAGKVTVHFLPVAVENNTKPGHLCARISNHCIEALCQLCCCRRRESGTLWECGRVADDGGCRCLVCSGGDGGRSVV